MTDVVLIHESPYITGQYYRVDFLVGSIRRAGLSLRLHSCGPASPNEARTVGWEIEDSVVHRLLNFLAYLMTFRSFAHFGFLLKMWQSLSAERPKIVAFYSHWTGMFLLFWRKITGVKSTLIWDWYDLSTRAGYYRREVRLIGKLLLGLEERMAPSHFEGLIVPTVFAQRLLQSWGHPLSKIHVLGEVRTLNSHVTPQTLEKRVEEVRNGGPLDLVWIGVIRRYQLDGLLQFLSDLREGGWDDRKTVIHVVGPSETQVGELKRRGRSMPPGITLRWHGDLSLCEMDRLLAQGHIALHPLPHELFCDFIYSRKMADYLAAALPVAFSAVAGLSEIGASFGIPFHLNNADSVNAAMLDLVDPENYRRYALAALTVADRELSKTGLSAKEEALGGFLTQVVRRSPNASTESAT